MGQTVNDEFGDYPVHCAARVGATEAVAELVNVIDSDGKWIKRGSENWLWLPPGCRPGDWAVSASTITIGCSSGRVLIMTFPSDN